MIAWRSSGEIRLARAVNPATSAKSTVTAFRSPSRAAAERRIFSARWDGVYARTFASWSRKTVSFGADEPAAAGVVTVPAALVGSAVPPRGDPHSEQNRNAGGFWVPHRGHPRARAVPQAPQNLAPAEFSKRHAGQGMGTGAVLTMRCHHPTRFVGVSSARGCPTGAGRPTAAYHGRTR